MSLLLNTGVFNLNAKDAVRNITKYFQFGRTPLIEAAIHGKIECVKVLIEAGASVNLFNKYQNTALHVAAQNNRANVVTLLLENRADIMRKNYVMSEF